MFLRFLPANKDFYSTLGRSPYPYHPSVKTRWKCRRGFEDRTVGEGGIDGTYPDNPPIQMFRSRWRGPVEVLEDRSQYLILFRDGFRTSYPSSNL